MSAGSCSPARRPGPCTRSTPRPGRAAGRPTWARRSPRPTSTTSRSRSPASARRTGRSSSRRAPASSPTGPPARSRWPPPTPRRRRSTAGRRWDSGWPPTSGSGRACPARTATRGSAATARARTASPSPGATAATFTPASGDAGVTLRVQVTATNAIGASGPVTSSPSAVVRIASPVNVVAPAISGTAAVGETLTAASGTWSGSPTSYAYQWVRCNEQPSLPCGDIPGATAATYEPIAADAGMQLVVRVIATNAGGDSDPVSSSRHRHRAAGPAGQHRHSAGFRGPSAAGRAADGQSRHVGRQPDELPLPVVQLRSGRPELPGHRRRHPADLPHRGRAGRALHRRRRHRHERRAATPSPRASDAFGPVLIGYPPDLHPADDRRHAAGRPDADGHPGNAGHPPRRATASSGTAATRR